MSSKYKSLDEIIDAHQSPRPDLIPNGMSVDPESGRPIIATTQENPKTWPNYISADWVELKPGVWGYIGGSKL